jgi:hypothetical protein
MANAGSIPTYEPTTVQLKGEVMDLEFTLDSDHRKRRRNRTTQSCLNCHTSKRKCDRKRPCQRCIQLGLTGLCVYEIDDPALRDDPTLDESTRLRNRIAELESLVRELRGKPHPRWAEGNFRDGDQSERWHSRAQKYSPQVKRGPEPESVEDLTDHHDTQITSIKTEPRCDNTHSHLYGFSSPAPSSALRYNNFQSGVPSPPIFPYDNDRHTSYDSGSPRGGSTMAYTSSATAPAISYHHQHPDSSSTYSNSSGGYDQNDFDEDRAYSHRFAATSFCTCRTNPGAAHALISLTHQLQNATNSLRQYAQHTPDSPCLLYRRIAELNHLMVTSSGNIRGSTSTYGPGALPTPTDSEIMSPLSSTSSPYDPPSAGHHGQEWAAIAAAGYNPYFPLQSGETNMYNN